MHAHKHAVDADTFLQMVSCYSTKWQLVILTHEEMWENLEKKKHIKKKKKVKMKMFYVEENACKCFFGLECRTVQNCLFTSKLHGVSLMIVL